MRDGKLKQSDFSFLFYSIQLLFFFLWFISHGKQLSLCQEQPVNSLIIKHETRYFIDLLKLLNYQSLLAISLTCSSFSIISPSSAIPISSSSLCLLTNLCSSPSSLVTFSVQLLLKQLTLFTLATPVTPTKPSPPTVPTKRSSASSCISYLPTPPAKPSSTTPPSPTPEIPPTLSMASSCAAAMSRLSSAYSASAMQSKNCPSITVAIRRRLKFGTRSAGFAILIALSSPSPQSTQDLNLSPGTWPM